MKTNSKISFCSDSSKKPRKKSEQNWKEQGSSSDNETRQLHWLGFHRKNGWWSMKTSRQYSIRVSNCSCFSETSSKSTRKKTNGRWRSLKWVRGRNRSICWGTTWTCWSKNSRIRWTATSKKKKWEGNGKRKSLWICFRSTSLERMWLIRTVTKKGSCQVLRRTYWNSSRRMIKSWKRSHWRYAMRWTKSKEQLSRLIQSAALRETRQRAEKNKANLEQ